MTCQPLHDFEPDRVFVTAELAAYAAGVSRTRLRVWAHRMTVPVACDVHSRRLVFALDAVMRHAQIRRVHDSQTIAV